MGKTKTFLVRFTETNAYTIKVQAEDADDAVQIAQDKYESKGPKAAEGFEFDDSHGGTDGWDAEEVRS
jgi:hypothetical protein